MHVEISAVKTSIKGTQGPILRYSTRSNRSVLLTTVIGKVLRNVINSRKHVQQAYLTNVNLHSSLCIKVEHSHQQFYCLFKSMFMLTVKQTQKVYIIRALCERLWDMHFKTWITQTTLKKMVGVALQGVPSNI